MCGIAGFLDFKAILNKENLVAMTDALAHRGPDASDYQMFPTEYANLGLGHRRLAIIDLSEKGQQPMHKNGWWIVFNGEIYNYKTIKKELIDLGYAFNTNTDTEVILVAFEAWGTEALAKFNGMFAFVIYNEIAQKIWFVRDRAGVKPLYIYEKNGLLLFASELKAFHQVKTITLDIDTDALQLYFQYGRVPTPNCIYKHCYKLKQGSYLEIDLTTKNRKEKIYWDIFNYSQKTFITQASEAEILQETEKLLTSAFNYRMVADVPVGVFLSGGYDSSLVTALLQKGSSKPLKTFTIGFESTEHDESPYAKEVAKHLGTDHNTYICTETEAKEIIPILPFIFDEPFGDSSSIPTYLVSKVAKEQVKVALSADGGDEQFVGYRRYIKALKVAAFIKKNPTIFNKSIGYALKWTSNKEITNKLAEIFIKDTIKEIPNIQTQLLLKKDLKQLLKQFKLDPTIATESRDINAIFAAEYQNYLQDDILVKVDRATMAVGLEGREPFLDYRIAEWAMKLPVKMKYKNSTLKYLLKKITHKYLPEPLMDRPKKGFSLPINKWLRTELKYLVEAAFEESFVAQQNLFSLPYLKERKNRFLSFKDDGGFVWHFIMFQLWYKQWHH